MEEKVIILDSGSQYTQLIARRVRELGIYCEITPFNKIPDPDTSIKAFILSGSPFSVKDENALQLELDKFVGKVPVLAICYGAQFIANYYGGTVEKSDKREYGKASLHMLTPEDEIFHNIPEDSQIWMSHGDTISRIPEGFELLAGTESITTAAFKAPSSHFGAPVYCLQFHPEVAHSLDGLLLMGNFLKRIVGMKGDWTPAHFAEHSVIELREKIGSDHVLLGLSGGVDSSVAALLLKRAIGDQLICFFIDNGLLRKNEFEEVLASYQNLGLKVFGIDAKQQFYDALKGISDPEKKRKAIGRVFIEVFEREAAKYPEIKWLAQGTIYPDVIESVSVHGPSVTIKSHHNVGGLPDLLKLNIVEPLRMLFKDEVRKLGKEIEVPTTILHRHPYPGPGLGIRIIGDITPEKVALLQEADHIFIENLKKFDLYDDVWQAGTILLPVQSVGVMGDERTYEQTVALRAVSSTDGMTAEWSRLPNELLATVSTEIINNVKGINRVVYDISTKPPATIEWE
jgi:GMP synthase (glutamine-hydrolysing)